MLMCEEGKGRDARALGRKGGIFLGRRSRYRQGRASLSRDRTHGRAHRSIAPASHHGSTRPRAGRAADAPSGRAEPRFWRPRRAQRSCVLPQHTRHLDWVVTSQRRASGSGLRDGGKGRRAHWGEGRVVRLVTYGQQKTISSSSHTHEQRLSSRANARGRAGEASALEVGVGVGAGRFRERRAEAEARAQAQPGAWAHPRRLESRDGATTRRPRRLTFRSSSKGNSNTDNNTYLRLCPRRDPSRLTSFRRLVLQAIRREETKLTRACDRSCGAVRALRRERRPP